jgi:hypothetical protein
MAEKPGPTGVIDRRTQVLGAGLPPQATCVVLVVAVTKVTILRDSFSLSKKNKIIERKEVAGGVTFVTSFVEAHAREVGVSHAVEPTIRLQPEVPGTANEVDQIDRTEPVAHARSHAMTW